MARISLCLIARNEEGMLPGCLASVAGAVDQIVLVDTGSTDRTRDLAREAGAVVAGLPWGEDFAAPRNEALRHATGDWVLQLDCDERLAPGAAKALRRAAGQGGFDVGLLPLHHASRLDAAPGEILSGRARLGAPIHLPRLLRRTPDLAWRGRIHECVSEWAGRRGNRLRGVPADLLHLGNVPGLRDGRAKRERNLGLLRRRCAEEPDDVTAFGYLAAELLAGGEREEAARVAEAGWALLPSQPAHRGVQRLATVRALCAWAGGDDRRTLDSAEGTERREALGADLRWLRGAALLRQAAQAAGAERARLAARAEEAFAEARRPAPGPVQYGFLADAGGALAAAGQGDARLLLGRPDEAEEAYAEALALRPSLPAAALGRADAALARGDATRALALLEPLLGESPDGWLVAAEAALALGGRADARDLLARAVERAPAGFETPHRAPRLRALAAALEAAP